MKTIVVPSQQNLYSKYRCLHQYDKQCLRDSIRAMMNRDITDNSIRRMLSGELKMPKEVRAFIEAKLRDG